MAFKNENTDKNFMSFTTSYTTTHSHSHHKNHHPSSTTQQQPTQTPRHKWAAFTYIDKETLQITNVLKHTGLK